MHRSRLAALGIDVAPDDHRRSAAFWAGALGGEPVPDEGDPDYIDVGEPRGLAAFVQRIGDGAPRVHLDIETDDIDAEVARLEALGATRVEQIKGWWVLRDPAGLPFCVVEAGGDFPAQAATWDDT